MPFDLRVQFAGLCLYLLRPEQEEVVVLMPDCRGLEDDDLEHFDGTLGDRHAGYLRMNLENFADNIPPGDEDTGPRFEIIHRFGRQQMDLNVGPAEAPIKFDKLPLPDFNKFAPTLLPIADLLGSAPPRSLLFRMTLKGGVLGEEEGTKNWAVPAVLHPKKVPHGGKFTGFVTWTRHVKTADQLEITIRDFTGATGAELKLTPKPAGGVISLKVANLCERNPLEWSVFPKRRVKEDRDFKWLYKLLSPGGGPQSRYDDELADAELPFPRVKGGSTQPQGDEACVGAKIQIPPPPTP